VRYKGSIELKVTDDAFVVVVVRGEQPLDPVVSRAADAPPMVPFALTNPIYLDRDGDGRFTPPRKR
jgi:hypothetical protein